MADDKPKIIVDTDWKAQAQAEKERLAAQEAASKPKSGASAAPGQPGASSPGGAPGASLEGGEQGEISVFEELLRTLASQALLYMGAFPDPQTGQAILAPEYAKLHIDMLGVLEEKTKGNLTEQEAQTLRSYLHELRMQFVELSRAVAKAIQEGRIKPGPGGGLTTATTVPPPPST